MLVIIGFSVLTIGVW